MHTEHTWAPAVKMYPFIQKCPLADTLSGAAMRYAVRGMLFLCLLVVVLLIKKIGIYLDPFFSEARIALKMTVFLH